LTSFIQQPGSGPPIQKSGAPWGSKTMANLAVFALGYVGSVSAACFASRGQQGILLAPGSGKEIIDRVGLLGLKHSANGYSRIAW